MNHVLFVSIPVIIDYNYHGLQKRDNSFYREEIYEKEIRTKNVDNGINCSNDLQFSTGSCGDRFGE